MRSSAAQGNAFLNRLTLRSFTSRPIGRSAASLFSADGLEGSLSEKKQRVLAKLAVFFERFFGLSSGGQ